MLPSLLHAITAAWAPILEICALTRAVDPDAAARTITADGSVGDVGEASLFDWHHGMFEGGCSAKMTTDRP